MNLKDFSDKNTSWFEGSGPLSSVVISSRIRLARNLAGYPFESKCSNEKKSQILNILKKAILDANIHKQIFFLEIDNIDPIEKDLLVERQLISTLHAKNRGPRGLLFAPEISFAAMINEEDHLRMQIIKPGLQIEQCWKQINSIDDKIEKKIDYAFSPEFGYLTACPTNLGTGIRVSVMLHLPALKITGHIEKFFNATRDLNLAVRGLFGEGTQATGDFFQVSNQVTLGVTEDQLINDFTNSIIPRIVEYENIARNNLLEKDTAAFDDKIFRAMGILENAHLITSQESLYLLSSLRLGVNMNRIPKISIKTINELFLLTQPAHLQVNYGKQLSPEQRDILRAKIIREKLSQN